MAAALVPAAVLLCGLLVAVQSIARFIPAEFLTLLNYREITQVR
eukprot:gene36561-37129_t